MKKILIITILVLSVVNLSSRSKMGRLAHNTAVKTNQEVTSFYEWRMGCRSSMYYKLLLRRKK